MFPGYDRKCLLCKAIHNWVEKFSQGRLKVADHARPGCRSLRQQSKDFYAAGFDALVTQWDKCINVGDGYVEK
jgi:predicted DCC family thiol-disulfide oxidoreductase YuxK